MTRNTDTISEELKSGEYPGILNFSEEVLKESLGTIAVESVIGNADEVKKRQHLLNPKDYRGEVKTPNPGKPPHNMDPFPVDQKIEELEVHKPDVKIHTITTHVHGEPAAKAAMMVGDTAEKRLIKLENNMATIMRYLFRLGSRVQINCVYYGGQSPFEKYRCIRCMKDDRIEDGQLVQIDQCLCCTRYEPVFGQCYEIMNDLGANVAAILDDNQMGYSNMEDYIKFERVEKFQEEMKQAEYDLSKVLTKDAGSQEFSPAVWGKGIAMDWTPVPKELQKPHINKRQSVTAEGTGVSRLNSYPANETESGNKILGSSLGRSISTNVFMLNKNAMNKNAG